MGTEEKSSVEDWQKGPYALISLEENEKRHVIYVLKALNGNRAATAKVLGIDRRSLYRRLERYFGKEHSTLVPSVQRGLRERTTNASELEASTLCE